MRKSVQKIDRKIIKKGTHNRIICNCKSRSYESVEASSETRGLVRYVWFYSSWRDATQVSTQFGCHHHASNNATRDSLTGQIHKQRARARGCARDHDRASFETTLDRAKYSIFRHPCKVTVVAFNDATRRSKIRPKSLIQGSSYRSCTLYTLPNDREIVYTQARFTMHIVLWVRLKGMISSRQTGSRNDPARKTTITAHQCAFTISRYR